MTDFDISVIIPIFDDSIYLPNCLNSIINQSLDNIEIILINNSDKNIGDLVNLYSNKFDNIKVVNQKSNNFHVNLNLGISDSSSKYVFFIDSNDYIERNMLEKLFSLSEKDNLDISMCKISAMDDLTHDFDSDLHDLSLSALDNLDKEKFNFLDFLDYFAEIYSKPFNKLFNKSFLLRNNISFPDLLFGDEVFTYETLIKADKISVINDHLYVRRFNSRFIKNFKVENYEDIFNYFILIRDLLIEKDVWDICKIKVYNHFIKLILNYFDLTSDEYKENFFIKFKRDFQNLLIEDQVLSKLNANYIVRINSFIYSDDYQNFLNKNEKVFSVVIPCYNVEGHLEDSIISVINQTLDFNSFIEIIFIDSGSEDNTQAICKDFVKKYPDNIKFLVEEDLEFNIKNFAFKNASGRYVNFLNPRESLKTDTLSNAYNFFEEHYSEISLLDSPVFFYDNNYCKFNEEYNKLFSVVIPCYNVEEYLEDAILSIINQTLDFKENIEIVLVDDGSCDNTANICKDFVGKYPNNIKFIHQKNQGQAAARNLGLKHVSGKYVNFLDADDTLMEDTFSEVHKFFEKHYDEIDLVAFPMYFFGKKSGNHVLNYKFKKNRIVNLDGFWDYPQLSASSAVFKSKLFTKFEFDTTLISSEDSVMVNKILLEKMAYGVIKSGGYNYRKRFDESSTIDSSINDKKYYNDRLKGYFCELIDYAKYKLGHVPKFIQYLIVYDIKWMFLDGEAYSLLNEEELFEFNKNLRYIFANIEDEVINFHFKKDPYKMKIFMFELKYGVFNIENNDGKLSLTANNNVLEILNENMFFIDIIEIENDNLLISGLFESYFDKNDFDIALSKCTEDNEEKFYPNYVSYSNRQETDYSGSILCFDFKIPLSIKENTEIKINIIYHHKGEDILINPEIKFSKYARMSELCNYSVWGDYFIKFENNMFIVSKYSYLKFLKAEIPVIFKIFKIKESYWTSAICFHVIYLLLFLFYRNKKIWLVMDRQDRADDNAEHLYNYMLGIKDGFKKYFVLSKDSPDYTRLSSKWKNILAFYSIKHRILYLFADKIISSQADEIIVNPFMGKNIKLYSGLITSDKIFLQHGVAKDDMSTWLRKYDKNVKLLVTTSDMEAKSFENYNYNYDEGVVQVLGLPRYDSLSNDSDNKQILIMPSWRRNLINASEEQILKSEYFARFNSLINNERFIKLAKSLGYKIIFKPHPNTFEFIELFDTNDYVIIDDKSKYQELFNNSSLLITDYSSLSFDFAYLKKPVIYYQYGNDYHFDNNFFVFETMGFGEVINDEDDLINLIEEYLNNGCKSKDVYLKRSNSFYKFNDKYNSKRVYEAIKKIN